MIAVTKLLCDSENFGDQIRYGHGTAGVRHGAMVGYGPVTVWHCTKTCNLKCIHCYANSDAQKYEGELSTAEAMAFIDDLAAFKAPVLLFSGGEPFARPDVLDLARYANGRGVRATFSTNGTLIDKPTARTLKEMGVGYVGISLDGVGGVNDAFRGKKGAFEDALRGIRNCREVGQRVGLRFVINRHNYDQLRDIFRLIEEEDIPRVCFYHLVYSGRGSAMTDQDVSYEEARLAMDLIIEKTLDYNKRGLDKEILTVDNHADVVYLYLKLKDKDPDRANKIIEMMRRNGGNRVGIAFADVDNIGNVHCDQFTQHHSFGNIREEKFSQIWTEAKHPILAGLKNRKPLLKGRCAGCRWLDICNGNFRTRAEAVTGDFWESDPACYLTDQEIGLA